MILNRSRLRPEAFTTKVSATDFPPALLGGTYESTDGKVFRLVQLDDAANPLVLAQFDACGYKAGSTTGTIVTVDISDSASGLFAGTIQSSTEPVDDDFIWIQVGGIGKINLAAPVAVNPGDAFAWTADGKATTLVAASNNVAAKCAITSGGTAQPDAYITGVQG